MKHSLVALLLTLSQLIIAQNWNEQDLEGLQQIMDENPNISINKTTPYFHRTRPNILLAFYNSKAIFDFHKGEMRLVELYLTYKDLKQLDLSKFTKLKTLVCHNNQITTLDLSNNPELDWLDCSNNDISSLDLSNNKYLRTLFCVNNKLSSLDLSNNKILILTNCSENKLTHIDLSNNKNLLGFLCNNNQLIALDLSNSVSLKNFQIENNPLQQIANSIIICENWQPKLEISNIYQFVRCKKTKKDQQTFAFKNRIQKEKQAKKTNISIT